MPGKMRTALNQFSYDIMKIRVGEAPKKICSLLEKNDGLLFLRLYNSGLVDILKVGFGANVSNAFLLNCWQRYFIVFGWCLFYALNLKMVHR